jgi:ligand-binding sensor domain-containing protein/signal transduction histidine kinase
MIRNSCTFTLVSLLMVLLTPPVFPQSYPFKSYSTGSGLAHSTVRVVFQDSHGFLWFGTRGGLNRYDGHEFLEYLSQGKEKSSIHVVYEDTNDNFLIGTYGNGLARLRAGDTNVAWMNRAGRFLPGDNVTAIHNDRRGNLWVGTDGGLVVLLPDGTKKIYRDEFGKPIGEIYGIVRDTQGVLWVATHTGLLRVQVDAEWRIISSVVVNKPTRSVLLRRNGDLIAGTSGGGNDKFGVVCRVREGTIDTIISYRTSGRLIKGQALYEDANNILWVGTEYGAYRVHDNIVTHIGTQNGLQNENVYCITQDHEGTMWFATGGGVIKLPRPWILSYGMKDGLSSHVALSLHEDTRGNIWVGMYNGLTRISRDGSVKCWDESSGLVHHTVRSISADSRGRLWVTTPLGVNLVVEGRVLPCRVPELEGRIDAWNICADPRGGLWLGLRGRIVKIEGDDIRVSLDSSSGLTSEVAQPLRVDRSGRLWFTNGNRGVCTFASDRVRFATTADGLPDDRVHSVFEDSRGRIWIGTESGVAQWSDNRRRAYPLEDSVLASMAVYVIMEDSLGNIWFGTDHGAYEYTGALLQQYSAGDGLSNDVIQTGLVGRNGEVWLGTDDGVSRFEKLRQPSIVPVPSVYLKNILAGDLSKPISDGGTVTYDDRSLVFLFNSLSFVNERELRFQWMLEGLDLDWLLPQKQRQVRYTNLSTGQYTFSVRAANKNGEWSVPTSVVFSVLPPYWQTWWFILLCFAVAVSLAYAVHRYRLGQMLKVERMRTRIAADLHDDIASSLSSVALYADVIQRQVADVPAETQELLSRIRDLSRESMEKIALIVWSVDPRRDEVSEVVTFFQRHAMQMCSAAGITFDSPGVDTQRSLPLTPEQRRTVYLILKEGLNNIIRHAACSKILFRCRVEDRTLHVMLTDNGRGFVTEGKGQGHGLQNMHSRAAAIGARLSITSSPGNGTSLELNLRIA